MSFRTTIILALIAAALGGFAYYDSKRSEEKKEKEEKQKVLLELKKEDITEIQIDRTNDVITLKPSGKDRWNIVSPLQTRADDASVGRIVSSVEKIQYKDIVDEQGKNLKEYHLDNPETKFTITTKQGKKHSILVGARNPVMNVNYLRINNDPRVYSVEGEIADAGSLSLLDLRDKKLTDFSSDKVESVRVNTPTLGMFFKKEAGSWKMKEPVDSPASDSEVSSLLSSLEFLRAAHFIDQSGPEATSEKDIHEKLGLAKPSASVEINLEKGLKQKIDFGNKVGEQIYVNVVGNPSLAMVQDSFTTFFDKKLDDWREKKLIVFNRFDVEDIRIKHQGVEYALRKTGQDQWNMTSPSKGPVADEKVQSLLEKLEVAEIEKYGDKNSLDASPELEISLTSKDWQNVQTRRNLLFGKVTGEQQAVKNDAYNTVVFVKGHTSKQIADGLAELKVQAPQSKPADATKKK
jgi:hypothetical protein